MSKIIQEIEKQRMTRTVPEFKGDPAPAPSFRATTAKVDGWIKPVDGRPLTFRTAGQATDVEIQAREVLAQRERLDEAFALHTGRPKELVHEDMERDRFFDAKQAVDYGLCDEVIGEDSGSAAAVAAADGSKPKE